jgi:hypothetical protein
VGARVTDNHNGTWHYEYAVHNLNADRAGGSFAVPMRTGATITNIGFHGVFSHSGEPYPNRANNPDNWQGAAGPTGVTWNCPEPFTGNGDSGNAIRWGTLYNFRFDANVAPTTAAASVGLYKPGSPSMLSAAGIPVPGLPCPSDFNRDGAIDFFDYLDFVQAFSTAAAAADFNSDGIVDFFDYLDFVDAFSAGC